MVEWRPADWNRSASVSTTRPDTSSRSIRTRPARATEYWIRAPARIGFGRHGEGAFRHAGAVIHRYVVTRPDGGEVAVRLPTDGAELTPTYNVPSLHARE